MSPPTGTELKELRLSKGITLEQASRDTCMRAGLLQDLEASANPDLMPDVYQKLSLRMYARYLGIDYEVTRRATAASGGRVRVAPVGLFIRRMGRAPKAPRIDPAQRNRLLNVAKTTSAALVTVLAVGLWSLNAKISRLNFDDRPVHHAAPVVATPVPEPAPAPSEPPAAPSAVTVSLDESVHLTLDPAGSGL